MRGALKRSFKKEEKPRKNNIMTNFHRGDVSLELGGERFTLRLTLQALAEIEAAFGVADLQALGERLSRGRVSARDLVLLLGASLRGGGAAMSDAALAQRITASDLPMAIAALGQVFALSFGGEAAAGSPNP